jgi:hypothetical protein
LFGSTVGTLLRDNPLCKLFGLGSNIFGSISGF